MSLPSQDLHTARRDAARFLHQLPQSSSRDEALETALQAAQSSLDALRLTSDAGEKSQFSAQAKQLMDVADAIKRRADWQSLVQQSGTAGRVSASTASSAKVKQLKEPVNSRELSTREQIIEMKATMLNNEKFPRWTGPPSPSEFERKDGEDLFLDEKSELVLSEFQLDVLDDWKRPSESLPPPSWLLDPAHRAEPTMFHQRDIDLVQDAATDCSVVASLCAGASRVKRGQSRLMSSFLYPYDAANDRPVVSSNGKYIVRLNFNGCYRRVVIDDRLPASSTNQVIHVVDRNNPALLWPALLEKAYLKVRGGYDFPGSNSATDLWILTGWIPEQVFLHDDLELDRLWKRISSGFSYGDVLITMGTGKMSSKTEKALGLAGEHDYAVLDLREVDGQRLLLIKNPWVEGTSWRGRFTSASPTESQTNAQHETPDRFENGMSPVQSPRDLLNDDDQLRPGTFWMDLDNVLQHFESMYLNWNSGLFSHRQDLHFAWDLPAAAARGPSASLQHNPQFTVTASREGQIWILLWRHFQNSIPPNAKRDDIESGRDLIDLNGFISLAVFLSNGRRVLIGERYVQKGWFVDSPQTLLKLDDCKPGEAYTIVPLEQDLPTLKHTLTLSAFSDVPITLEEAVPRYAHVQQLLGSWTKETAGGNAQTPTFCDNPQYLLKVTRKTGISLLLEACDKDLNVHVKLLHSNGKRVFRVRSKDIIVDSRDYRPGCCLAELRELEPGQYTIVCSTFEPQQMGNFGLRVESSAPAEASLLPREGAGRIRTELSTAVLKHGQNKVAAQLVPRRLSNFYAVARYVNAESATSVARSRSSHSHIRLTIESGRGPARQVLTASNDGEYSDSTVAVRTTAMDLSPGARRNGNDDYWLVLERMYGSLELQQEHFSVELLVDQPNAIEVGAWQVWEG